MDMDIDSIIARADAMRNSVVVFDAKTLYRIFETHPYERRNKEKPNSEKKTRVLHLTGKVAWKEKGGYQLETSAVHHAGKTYIVTTNCQSAYCELLQNAIVIDDANFDIPMPLIGRACKLKKEIKGDVVFAYDPVERSVTLYFETVSNRHIFSRKSQAPSSSPLKVVKHMAVWAKEIIGFDKPKVVVSQLEQIGLSTPMTWMKTWAKCIPPWEIVTAFLNENKAVVSLDTGRSLFAAATTFSEEDMNRFQEVSDPNIWPN
jgi:hypothetical protein